jgi:hypothetical protein
MNAVVRIVRKPRMSMGGWKPWNVVIDGSVAGVIEAGKQVQLPVKPGRHVVRVEADSVRRSPDRSFEAGEGEEVDFDCKSVPFGALTVPFWLLTLVKHDIWISLKPADGA